MPLHDWTRVEAGVFHSFHLNWIGQIVAQLNQGLLPEGYYALGEQVTNNGNPDVLTLHTTQDEPLPESPSPGGTMLLTQRPQTRLSTTFASSFYAAQTRRVVIRHVSGDRVVASLELVSRANKSSTLGFESFLNKLCELLYAGIHLLVVDLYPPTTRDPNGIHGAMTDAWQGEPFSLPTTTSRTLVSYHAGLVPEAFIETVDCGDSLPAMPLYLTADGYIEIPLEATYNTAFDSLPGKYRKVLSFG